jgi:hypothetical protein
LLGQTLFGNKKEKSCLINWINLWKASSLVRKRAAVEVVEAVAALVVEDLPEVVQVVLEVVVVLDVVLDVVLAVEEILGQLLVSIMPILMPWMKDLFKFKLALLFPVSEEVEESTEIEPEGVKTVLLALSLELLSMTAPGKITRAEIRPMLQVSGLTISLKEKK